MSISVLFLVPQISVSYIFLFCINAVSCEPLSCGFFFPFPNMHTHRATHTQTFAFSFPVPTLASPPVRFHASPLLNLIVLQCLIIANKISLQL